MEKLYCCDNGEVREFTEAEYAQWAIDNEHYLTVDLPNQIRQKRNSLLAQSDWTQVSDSPLNAEQKTEWTIYRQALRNLPEQSGFPANVVFPEQPK
jgi:hypothetical protein